MFTGLIFTTGIIKGINFYPDISVQIFVKDFSVALGDSISCSGICLTVSKIFYNGNDCSFCASVSRETISKTTFVFWKKDQIINIEKSLKVGDFMGGHFVYGHVDCIAKIASIEKSQNSWLLNIQIPNGLKNFILEKNSIAIDGISLTIARSKPKEIFTISLVPFTIENTTIKNYLLPATSKYVNIEADYFVKNIVNVLEQLK